MRPTTPIAERLWRRVADDPDGCWEWMGALSHGYGVLGVGRQGMGNVLAHRLAYELLAGSIPDDRPHIDHLCRNRRCVNPDHLEPVTQAENNRRAHAANPWTHCKRGHEMTPETTYPFASGGRCCAICVKARLRRQRRERRAS